MEGTSTCGYEITLLILCEMFKIQILVIQSDFLWVSISVAPRECGVVIIQNTSGEFLGTKSTCGAKLVNVGSVPRIYVNKRKSPIHVSEEQTSTPMDLSRRKISKIGEDINDNISPIVKAQDNLLGIIVESEFEDTFDLLKDANGGERAQEKVGNQVPSAVTAFEVRLSIRDIDNESSNDTVLNPGGGEHSNSMHELDSKDGSAITITSETSNDHLFDGQNMKLSGNSSLPDEDVSSNSDKQNDTELNDSTLTVTKIEYKSTDLSVTITPYEKSVVSRVSGEVVENNYTFFPNTQDVMDASEQVERREEKSVENEDIEKTEESVGTENGVDPDKATDEKITEEETSQADVIENDSRTKQHEAEIVEKDTQPKQHEADIVDPGHVVMDPAA